MAGLNMGIGKITVNTGSLADGSSIAAYLTDAAGSLITASTVGAKKAIDALTQAEHVDGTAYVATTDYLASMGAVDNGGNWKPLNLDASGNLKTSTTVDFSFDYAEDSAASDGDTGAAVLLVRQDTLAPSTSATGDYGNFKSNNNGELYVFDTTTHTTLTNIKSDTASIVTNTGTIVTNTGNIDSKLGALSKAEDAAHVSGDQGIQSLAVRKDASGSNVNTDGDYASIIAWGEGSVKVIDVANSSCLQQQITVGLSAVKLPTTALGFRKSLMVQNDSDKKMYIGTSTVTTSGATKGILLDQGSSMELEAGPACDVYAICGTAAKTVVILEMA